MRRESCTGHQHHAKRGPRTQENRGGTLRTTPHPNPDLTTHLVEDGPAHLDTNLVRHSGGDEQRVAL
jgi:hypothetical protein